MASQVSAWPRYWEQEGKTFKAFAVTTGMTNGTVTEILSGLKEGDEIITEFEMIGGPEAEGQGQQQNSNPFMPGPRNRNRNQNPNQQKRPQ